MKQAKITLTYVAEVDDEVTVDHIHTNWEDYVWEVINMNISDYDGEKLWNVRLQLQRTETCIGLVKRTTIYTDD